MDAVTNLVILSFASASSALAIRKLSSKSHETPYIGSLVRCAFCLSFWTAAFFASLAFPDLELRLRPVYTFAVYGGAAIVIGMIQRLWLWDTDEIEYLKGELKYAQEIIKELSKGEEK